MYKTVRFYLLTAVLLSAAACGGGDGGDSGNNGGNGGGGSNTPCPTPVRIQPDSVTQGTLASSDCTVVRLIPSAVGDQSYLDQYIVTLPAGGEFTIRMESAQFDAFLALFDTDPPELPPILEDDDSAGNLDALITAELTAGTYIIVANSTTATGVTGSYTLTTTFTPFVWTPTSGTTAPQPRTEHSAIWTGAEMIVWGGSDGNAIAKNDGGRYLLQTDSWSATDVSGAPAPRSGHTAVWSGTEMLVWGGFSGAFNFVALGDGAAYAPQTNSWSTISTIDAPSARLGHTALWTGSEMIVWGGFSCTGCANGELRSGARYDPATDVWTPVSMNGAPDARGNHSAVWTGDRMIVWGGEKDGVIAPLTLLNTGGTYDPVTDSWTTTSLVSAPLPTRCASAVWADSAMLVFGGQTDGNLGCGASSNNRIAAYDPVTDAWTSLADAPVASGISGPRAIWTGLELITWFDATGARYRFSNDSWRGIDPSRAPDARRLHTLVWTGEKMIVWGGDFAGPLNSGGVYTPDLDPTP